MKETDPKKGRGAWHQIKEMFRTYLVAGLLVLVPLLATLWVLRFIIQTMDNIFLPAVLKTVLPNTQLPNHYYGLGAIFTVAIVILVGAMARSFLAGRMVAIGEGLIARIPFVSTVYGAVKQLLETVFRKEHKDFRGVALVPFPHPEVYSVGFITSKTMGEVQTKTPENVINVFIPTTPNPTTGFYIMVPLEKAIVLDMSVEEAFKMVMSAGIVAPPERVAAARAQQGTFAAAPGNAHPPADSSQGSGGTAEARDGPSRARG